MPLLRENRAQVEQGRRALSPGGPARVSAPGALRGAESGLERVEPVRRRLALGLFTSCANPACASGWLKFWRSRSAPVFEGGWSCSPACTRGAD